MAYAIIEDSGTQLKVEPGDRFEIDLREMPAGQDTVTFDKVLFVSSEGGVKVGKPTVAGATVSAKILGEIKGGKFAQEWILDTPAGRPVYNALRRKAAEHQIEEVGEQLRSMMPWIGQGKAKPRDVSGG